MRELAALNIYSIQELESSKFTRVSTREDCVKAGRKLEELKQAWAELKKDKPEYINDKLAGRILIRLESAVNFISKAASGFTNVADSVILERKDLEQKRNDTLKKLDDSKMERAAEVAAGKAKMEVESPTETYLEPGLKAVPVAAKKKPGRPKKNG